MKLPLMLALVCLAILPALALAGEEAAKTDTSPRFEAYEQVTDTMTIVRIDPEKRLVTLKDADGDTIVIEAGEEVRNFAQLRVDDLVVTTYKESFVIHVDTTGIAEATRETVTGRAELGEKPSVSRFETTTVKATVSAIDKKAGTVTLTTLNNEPFTITPLNPANLERVKVGDVVVFTHKLTTAIAVEKPGAEKEAPAKK